MNGPESLRLGPVWRGLGYLAVVALLTACLWPQADTVGPQGIDKLLHLTAFALVAAWFGALVRPSRYPVLALALAAFGLAIEALQWLTGYRSAELMDWLADLAGIAVGLALARPVTGPCLYYIDARVAAARNRA